MAKIIPKLPKASFLAVIYLQEGEPQWNYCTLSPPLICQLITNDRMHYFKFSDYVGSSINII